MTAYYSNLITDSSANTTLVQGYRAPVGLSHSRTRNAVANITGLLTTSDTARMITLKSGDRLRELWICSDGGSDAGACQIGLHLYGSNHDGAVVDVDLFTAAVTTASAQDLTDVFDAGALSSVDRGKTLWELAAIGDASYTEDPLVQFDISITPGTTFTNTATEITLIAVYTSGD